MKKKSKKTSTGILLVAVQTEKKSKTKKNRKFHRRTAGMDICNADRHRRLQHVLE